MSRAEPRRTPRARAHGALGALLLLALLGVAALLLAGSRSDAGVTHRSTDHPSLTVAISESGHHAPTVHPFHQQPATRARTVAFGLLAVAVAFGTWAFRRVLVVRSGRPRTLRISGLPPGRAPPRLRIA